MDARHRRRPSADRFLTTFSFSPPSTAATSASTSAAGEDLSEDEIFFASTDFYNSPSASTSPSLSHHHLLTKPFKPDSSGILAALPESAADIASSRSVFNHKALISRSPPPSRVIPVVPRPSLMAERQSPGLYPQSAPVNVPAFSRREKRRCEGSVFGYEDDVGDDGENDDDEEEMLPPHEIVARNMSRSPIVSCSVLEGAGRTLKGRDLRRVRNAVFRQTGFID